MGASDFWQKAKGATADKAFISARKDAAWDHGHGGYTGTIAEKHEFVLFTVPEGTEPQAYAQMQMDDDASVVQDKWGPAGCVKLNEGEFLFFGWASS